MVLDNPSKDERTSLDDAIMKVLQALCDRKGLNISQVAKEANLHWKTANKALTLLIQISTRLEGKGIDSYDGGSSKMFVLSDRVGLEKYPPEMRDMFIRSEFPETTKEQRVLVDLLLKGATSTRMAIRLDNLDELLDKLAKMKRIKRTKDKRVFLTDIGLSIARGTMMTYPELLKAK